MSLDEVVIGSKESRRRAILVLMVVTALTAPPSAGRTQSQGVRQGRHCDTVARPSPDSLAEILMRRYSQALGLPPDSESHRGGLVSGYVRLTRYGVAPDSMSVFLVSSQRIIHGNVAGLLVDNCLWYAGARSQGWGVVTPPPSDSSGTTL